MSYYFCFHLSNPSWSCVAFTVLSRICVIVNIIIFIIIFPARSLGSKMWGKDEQFHSFFSSRFIHETRFKLLLLLLLLLLLSLLFMVTCFKFYLPNLYDFNWIAVLICYRYFIIYRIAEHIMSLEHCGGFLFCPSLLLVSLDLARNEDWVVPRTLCSLRCRAGVFLTFKESCIINF